MPAKLLDCEFLGRDEQTGKFVVKEQLFPEARGWFEHEFDTEAEALAWLDARAQDED